MKNVMLAFGLGVAFLLAGCGSGGYIETIEEAEAYKDELKSWGEGMKGVSDEDYFEAVTTKICDCVGKINLDAEGDTSTRVDSIRMKTITLMSFTMSSLVLFDVRDYSDNSNIEMQKIEDAVKLECPDKFDSFLKVFKFSMSLFSD